MNKSQSIDLAKSLERKTRALAANNQARIRQLRRYADDGFINVFNQVPLILNVNQSGAPGYVPDPQTPCGVKYINQQQWLPPEERLELDTPPQAAEPAVESLFLIGSSGSIGQSASSDLDYWVCHEDRALQGRALELFQQKLSAITHWAKTKHGTEANFYLVKLSEFRQGRLGKRKKTETEGEAAPALLLEELYRTFLFVAGRQPLWPVLPLATDQEMYQYYRDILAGEPESKYVDLGLPVMPPPQEVLAAAHRLAHKSEANPFKGLLKITLLLDYVESGLKCATLCHKVKEDIMNAAESGLPVDPYELTINRVTENGHRYLNQKELDLLRMAAALKVVGVGSAARPAFFIPENSPKKYLLSQWAKKWNWSGDRIAHLLNYNNWPERELLHFKGELLNMFASVHSRIAQSLIKNFPGQITPQSEELAPPGRRAFDQSGSSAGRRQATAPRRAGQKSRLDISN